MLSLKVLYSYMPFCQLTGVCSISYVKFDETCNYFCRFLGDENGLFSVLKYDLEDGKIITMPYHIPLDSLAGTIFFTVLFLAIFLHIFFFFNFVHRLGISQILGLYKALNCSRSS